MLFLITIPLKTFMLALKAGKITAGITAKLAKFTAKGALKGVNKLSTDENGQTLKDKLDNNKALIAGKKVKNTGKAAVNTVKKTGKAAKSTAKAAKNTAKAIAKAPKKIYKAGKNVVKAAKTTVKVTKKAIELLIKAIKAIIELIKAIASALVALGVVGLIIVIVLVVVLIAAVVYRVLTIEDASGNTLIHCLATGTYSQSAFWDDDPTNDPDADTSDEEDSEDTDDGDVSTDPVTTDPVPPSDRSDLIACATLVAQFYQNHVATYQKTVNSEKASAAALSYYNTYAEADGSLVNTNYTGSHCGYLLTTTDGFSLWCRDDCTGFTAAYASYVCGHDIGYASSRTMMDGALCYLNNNWGRHRVSSLSDLQPGDIVVTSGHAEVYWGNAKSFGWGSVHGKTSIPTYNWINRSGGVSPSWDDRLYTVYYRYGTTSTY